MNTIDKRIIHRREPFRHKLIRANHELFNHSVTVIRRVWHYILDGTILIHNYLRLWQHKAQSASVHTHRFQNIRQLLHILKHRNYWSIILFVGILRLEKNTVTLIVTHSRITSNHALVDVSLVYVTVRIDIHLS